MKPNLVLFGSNLWYLSFDLDNQWPPREDRGFTKYPVVDDIKRRKLYFLKQLDSYVANLTKDKQLLETPLLYVLQDKTLQMEPISNDNIEELNDGAVQLFKEKQPRVTIWDSAHGLMDIMLSNQEPVMDQDRRHLIPAANALEMQFIFNYLFNTNCIR